MAVAVNNIKLQRSVNALLNSVRALPSTATPNIQKSLNVAAAYVRGTWIGAVSGNKIAGLSRTVVSQDYMQSIKVKSIAPLSRMVYTDSKVADYIEYGHSAIDLKAYLPFKRSYKAKDGHYYSIIPFRHNVKSVSAMGGKTMGRQIYNQMLSMEKSFVTGSRIETQKRGAEVVSLKRATYQWGSKLTGMRNRYDNVKHIERLEGMVRMETTSGASKGSSAYMTFRVISQRSAPNKWVIPFQMGLPVSKAVANNVSERVSKIVQAGIEKDLAASGT